MALGKNSGPAGLPPHEPDHGAGMFHTEPPVQMGPEHDTAMLGQNGHSASAGAGYTLGGGHGPARLVLSDDYSRDM